MKLKLHPGIGVAGAIVLSSLAFGLWSNTCISPKELERSLAPAGVPIFVPSAPPDSTPNSAPSLAENETSQNINQNLLPPTSEPVSAGTEASFRVSNQTNHPVRIAWRSRSATSEPVHWDFAPQEGSVSGLMLSLPDGDLTLEPGDIVIVFAQDGSRRYWGPYIVGETDSPAWNSRGEEWLLVVQP